MNRILVVEDEKSINDLIEMNLSEAGYDCVCCYDGEAAADILERESFDLVLLDIMLPKVDGYELLDFIKPMGVPVIFITAKGTMADKVRGLRLGADDYLVKPFEIVELLARVEAVLRRAGKTQYEIEAGGLTIDTRSHTVMRGSKPLQLTAKEFEQMIMSQGAVFGTYAEGAFDAFMKSGHPELITKEQYESWVQKALRPEKYAEVVAKAFMLLITGVS